MLNVTVLELSETCKSMEAWKHPECLTYYNLTLNSIYINVTKNPTSTLNEQEMHMFYWQKQSYFDNRDILNSTF